MQFHSSHPQWFTHAKMVAIKPLLFSIRVQRPTERTQFTFRQILKVDTEGELNSWLQRFEARMLRVSMLRVPLHMLRRFLDRSADLFKCEVLVSSQALVPIELMAADGSLVTLWWCTIVVVEFFLNIRMLLRKIMLECGGFWRRQYPGFNYLSKVSS